MLEIGSRDALPGARKHRGIELAGHDAAEAVVLQAFRQPERADAHESAGFNHQARLDGGDEAAQEFEHFDFGGHGVIHAPALRIGALGSGAMVFRLEQVSAAARGLANDLVLVFFFTAEKIFQLHSLRSDSGWSPAVAFRTMRAGTISMRGNWPDLRRY